MTGLTDAQVQERILQNQVEGNSRSLTKSTGEILRENIFTLFNFLNFIIACLLFYAGAYSNVFFIVIILMNITIGIYQQLKAKKLVDALTVVNHVNVHVIRNGKEIIIPKEEIVKDDILVLQSGMQVSNDAEVIQGNIEMDESLLTGESDGIEKGKDDPVYSGSYVVAGKAYAKVVHVGKENYASKLTERVKQAKLTDSEFLKSMRKVTRFTTLFIIPIGIVLMIEAMIFRGSAFPEAVINTSAALLGMLPKGLVLLMSVSLATGVIAMSKKNVLVQNPYALESMAHIDTICFDKTGTITTGKLKVREVLPLHTFSKEKTEALLKSYMMECEDNNATFLALKEYFHAEKIYQPVGRIPFHAERKWSAVSFCDQGTIFVGAAEKLLMDLPSQMKHALENGDRILAITYSSEVWQDKTSLPHDMIPLYGIVLRDQMRTNAKEMLDVFQKDGMQCKLISGDHVKTVSIAARNAGFLDYRNAIDLSELHGAIDYDRIAERYSIFARVTPEQKKKLIEAMQKKGHHTAMVGDGVNDLLAMKEADCAITIREASQAARQLSQIVLLDSDYMHLHEVITEGRRAVNNVTRSAGVFFIKTIYSLLVSVFCVCMNIPFPFIPLQITLIDAFIEAYPSFITIYESDTKKIRGHFLEKAITNAFPFALTITLAILFIYVMHPFSLQQDQTLMYVSLIAVSSLAVIKSCIPFDRLRSFICITMCAGIAGALLLMPKMFYVEPFTLTMFLYLLLVVSSILFLTFASFALLKKYLTKEKSKELHTWRA